MSLFIATLCTLPTYIAIGRVLQDDYGWDRMSAVFWPVTALLRGGAAATRAFFKGRHRASKHLPRAILVKKPES